MVTGTGRLVDLSARGIAEVVLQTRDGRKELYAEVRMLGDALLAIFGEKATRQTVIGQRVRYWRQGSQLMSLGPV